MSLLKESRIKKRFRYKENQRAMNARFHSNIKKLYLYNFFMGCYLLSGVLIPFYLIWGNLSFMDYIFLQTYYVFMILILEIPCSAIADQISRKLTLFLSGLTSALAALIYGIAPNIFLFYIGETLFALGTSLMSGANEAILHDSLSKIGKEEEFSKTLAKNNALFLLGIIISAPIGSMIGYFISIPLVMTLMFIPYIFGTLITLILKEPSNEFKTKKIKFFAPIKLGLYNLKKNKILRILMFDMLIIETLIFFLVVTYQFYLFTEFNMPIIYFGLIESSLTLLQMIFTSILSFYEQEIRNKKRMLFLTTLFTGISYIFIGLIFFPTIIILLILITIGLGLSRYIIFLNGLNEQIEEENRATMYSTINMIRMLIKLIFLPLIGFLLIFNINIIFILIGSIIIILGLKSKIKNEYLLIK